MTSFRRCRWCGVDEIQGRCPRCGLAIVAGRYQIEAVIAENDFARVYRARGESGCPVALKELLFARVPSVQQIEAFETEARVLGRLSHPNIPRLIESFREGEGPTLRLYLVQELVNGSSLAEAVATRRFTEMDTISVMSTLLQVLMYLHELRPRVLHRDLKPSNILLRPSGEPALVDFGSSRELHSDFTHRATQVGTFGYMPLQQMGGSLDESCDLYALGATAIHLLSGKAPDELLNRTFAIDFERHVTISAGLSAFLRRMVHAEPQHRFRTARDALKALDVFVKTHSKPEGSNRPWNMLTLLSLSLVGAFVASCIFLILRQPPESPPTSRGVRDELSFPASLSHQLEPIFRVPQLQTAVTDVAGKGADIEQSVQVDLQVPPESQLPRTTAFDEALPADLVSAVVSTHTVIGTVTVGPAPVTLHHQFMFNGMRVRVASFLRSPLSLEGMVDFRLRYLGVRFVVDEVEGKRKPTLWRQLASIRTASGETSWPVMYDADIQNPASFFEVIEPGAHAEPALFFICECPSARSQSVEA